jgi:hypothetical protein
MLPRHAIPAVAALVLVAAACGAPGASPSTVGPTSTPSSTAVAATCATSPQPSDMTGWSAPAQKSALLPVIVTNYVACGQARLLFLFLDDQNAVVSAPDRTAKVAFYDLAKDTAKPVVTADGTFMWTIEGERGMYAVNVDLPTAGVWGAELTTAAPGSPAQTSRLTFEVHDASPTISIGQAAPPSRTPTLADVDGDATRISTDEHPDPAFYTTSVADALAAHKPIMLVFATPKFCTSKQCGPTLEHFKPIAAANPDITFINVEPYQLHEVDGQLQPVLSDQNSLQPTDITDAWGLLSEPWIFAVDRDGIVRGSYEIQISPAELEAILPVIRMGG